MRAKEPPAPCLGMLFQHEKYPKQGHSGLNAKEMIKNNEKAQNSEGIRCKLGWNDMIEVKDINEERMKGKLKTGTKELFIHGHFIGWTRGYSIVRSQSMNVKSTWEVVRITH